MASSVPPSDLSGKARIRLAALSLFGRKGFDRTSLRLVAQRAHVSIALIGHHFGDKKSLHAAVCEWAVETLIDAASDGVPRTLSLAQVSARLSICLQEAVTSMDLIGPFVRRALTEAVSGVGQSRVVPILDAALTRYFDRKIKEAGSPMAGVESNWWARQTRTYFVGTVVVGEMPSAKEDLHATRLTAILYSWYRNDVLLTGGRLGARG